MDIDKDRIDAAALTLSWLNRESSGMAWKGFDWASTERLYERGLISNGGHGEIGSAIPWCATRSTMCRSFALNG